MLTIFDSGLGVVGLLVDDLRVYEELMETYNSIAYGYSSFRVRAWEVVKELSSCSGWVTDVGCGPCHNGLAYVLGSKARLVCIDLSYKMLEVAKMLALRYGGNEITYRVDLVQADMRYLPLRSESIDRSMYIASINHIQPKHLGMVLKEFFRVLKVGGEGLVTIWAALHPTVLSRLARNFIDLLLMRRRLDKLFDIQVPWRSRGSTYLRYYHIYRPSEILKYLRNLGFKVVRSGTYNPHRRILPENYYVVLSK